MIRSLAQIFGSLPRLLAKFTPAIAGDNIQAFKKLDMLPTRENRRIDRFFCPDAVRRNRLEVSPLWFEQPNSSRSMADRNFASVEQLSHPAWLESSTDTP